MKTCSPINSNYKIKHGMYGTLTYKVWSGLKTRCLNPNNKDFKYYGDRGIKVCERWLEFKNFYKDMGEKPKGLQIDRIDNNGNYTPKNCKWVTPRENSRNRRNTVLSVEIAKRIRDLRTDGLKLKEISKQLNIKMHNIYSVLYHNFWRKDETKRENEKILC